MISVNGSIVKEEKKPNYYYEAHACVRLEHNISFCPRDYKNWGILAMMCVWYVFYCGKSVSEQNGGLLGWERRRWTCYYYYYLFSQNNDYHSTFFLSVCEDWIEIWNKSNQIIIQCERRDCERPHNNNLPTFAHTKRRDKPYRFFIIKSYYQDKEKYVHSIWNEVPNCSPLWWNQQTHHNKQKRRMDGWLKYENEILM